MWRPWGSKSLEYNDMYSDDYEIDSEVSDIDSEVIQPGPSKKRRMFLSEESQQICFNVYKNLRKLYGVDEHLLLKETSDLTEVPYSTLSRIIRNGPRNRKTRKDLGTQRKVTDSAMPKSSTEETLETAPRAKKEPKSAAQRNREYRARKKALQDQHLMMTADAFGSTSQEPNKPDVHKDAKVYCRMCLNAASRNHMVCLGDFHDINYPSRTDQFRKNKKLKTEMYLNMIKMLMPNFQHDLVFNPIMCYDCSNRLQQASDFVEQCLYNQKLMELYRKHFFPNEKMIFCEDFIEDKPRVVRIANQASAKKRKMTKSSTSVSREVAGPSSRIPTAALAIESEIDEAEMDTNYKITTEEIIQIKQELEADEENCNIADDSEKDMIVKTEPCLSDTSYIKSEPVDIKSEIDDATTAEEMIQIKQEFGTTCSSDPVSAAAAPMQFCRIPVQFCPPLQPIGAPQTFVSLVNPVTAVSSTVSSTENKTGDFRDNSND